MKAAVGQRRTAEEEEKASQRTHLTLDTCSKCFPFSSSPCLLAIRGPWQSTAQNYFFVALPGVGGKPGKPKWRIGDLPFLPKVASWDVTVAVKGILLAQEVIVSCVREEWGGSLRHVVTTVFVFFCLYILGRDWRNVLTRVCRRRLGDRTMQFLPHQQLGLLKGEDTALTTYFLLLWSFHFCLGENKISHNLKKDLTNHLLCNPFTVPGLVKNCCNKGDTD